MDCSQPLVDIFGFEGDRLLGGFKAQLVLEARVLGAREGAFYRSIGNGGTNRHLGSHVLRGAEDLFRGHRPVRQTDPNGLFSAHDAARVEQLCREGGADEPREGPRGGGDR